EFGVDERNDKNWSTELSERERSVVNGALEPYVAHFAGGELDGLVWEPELFYTTPDPPVPGLVTATGPIDITGRGRYLVYGPFINLPPGQWFVDVVIGFSAEAAGMGFMVEVFAGVQLAQTRIEVAGEQVVDARLYVAIGESIEQPVQIRLINERTA